mgnify:CR=1 FL=1
MSTDPTPDPVRQRVQELHKLLHHHAHRYYVLDDPAIGDQEFDALFRELQALERDHPGLATADSPTQRVGGAAARSGDAGRVDGCAGRTRRHSTVTG